MEKFSLLTFGHYELAFVVKVAVNIICPVVNVHCTSGGACCKGRRAGLVMGPSLIPPGLTDLSFWMCHCCKIIRYLLLSFNCFKASQRGSVSPEL